MRVVNVQSPKYTCAYNISWARMGMRFTLPAQYSEPNFDFRNLPCEGSGDYRRFWYGNGLTPEISSAETTVLHQVYQPSLVYHPTAGSHHRWKI